MRPIADLLREALRYGDEQGRTQIRSRHLPDDLVADLAEQTYRYALDRATKDKDGRLVYREGIESCWCEAADLTKEHFGPLYMLRSDVVKRLTEKGLAYRPNPSPVFSCWPGSGRCA